MILMKIRKMQHKEVEKVSLLVKHTLRSLSDYPKATILKLSDDYDTDYFKSPPLNQTFFIAVDNNEILGTAAIQDNIIRDVYVHPSYQKKGIGTKLINYLEKLALEQGHNQMIIPANPFASEFYRKLGYFKIEEIYNQTYQILETKMKKLLD